MEKYKTPFFGMLAITLLDALGSIASRQLGFNYALLAPVVFFVYAIVGFIETRQYKLSTGVLIAAAVGLFDATVGWKISTLLKANTGAFKNDPSIGVWVTTAIFVMVTASVCGLAGGELYLLIKKKNTNPAT